MAEQRAGGGLDSLPVVIGVRSVLARAESGSEAVDGVLDRIGDTLSWRVGAFWMPAESGADTLRAVCTWHARVHRRGEFERITRGLRLHPGEGLPGRVWAGSEPVSVEDVPSGAGYPRYDAASAEGLRAAVAFPVASDATRHGVLEFFTDTVRIRTGPLLPAFELVGGELGAFLDVHPIVPTP